MGYKLSEALFDISLNYAVIFGVVFAAVALVLIRFGTPSGK
jgi:hypothetical protein